MHNFIIEQVFRYKMASKMAAKIINLNESNPKYTPGVYELRSRSQKWEIKSYTASLPTCSFFEHNITIYQFDVSLNDK